MDDEYFKTGLFFGIPVGIATFIGVWVAASYSFGMWGFMLGWLPAWIIAMIVGSLATLAWPLTAIGLAWLAIVIFRQMGWM